MARIEMDLKALDLAAESLRHHSFDQVSPECPASPGIHVKPGSFSQPVSPARVAGETSRGVASTPQEPQNNCDVEKVSFVNVVTVLFLKPHSPEEDQGAQLHFVWFGEVVLSVISLRLEVSPLLQ